MEDTDTSKQGPARKEPHQEAAGGDLAEKLPKTLFILPLRNGVIFPGVLSPLTVTNPNDLETVKAAEKRGEIGLVLMKGASADASAEEEDPEDQLMIGEEEAAAIEEEKLASLARLFGLGGTSRAADLFHKVGVYAKILKRINLPNGGVSLFLTVVRRFSVRSFFSTGELLIASVDFFKNEFRMEETSPSLMTAYLRLLHKEIKTISSISPIFSEEVHVNIANIDNPGRLADYIANNLDILPEEQQAILETIDVKKRIEQVLHFLEKEKGIIEIQSNLESKVRGTIEKKQREYFLREELRSIQEELGRDPSGGLPEADFPPPASDKISRLKRRFASLDLPQEASEAIREEFGKLAQMDPMMHEYSLSLTYIETVLSLPWNDPKPEKVTIEQARKVLDKDHYGLKDVKERILEFIAVRKLKNDTKGSIICLEGPPGVGKTSVGLSIARALGKKCFRFSVGGVRDEAEIKGHRRTYLGALPGKIIQGLKVTKTKDPVFLIDEIDKLQESSSQGDPASALLEVLDPEQNSSFRDNYIDLPFDVSQVLFMVTANDKSRIPKPLLDRMEVIELSGYTAAEKRDIARRYLVPKTRKANGLRASQVVFNDRILDEIAEGWAREPGVRNLEKALSRICRKIALRLLEDPGFKTPARIKAEDLKTYLGAPVFSDDEIIRADKVGMAIGLAYNGFGGSTLAIEAASLPGGKGELRLTGHLGDVIKESANIAFSLLRSHAAELGLDPQWFKSNDLHIHFPDGATPKDGPSAGAAICCAIYSLVSGRLVRPELAMTGELSLTGRVMEIGGLKEKTLAVARNKFTRVIIPKTNRKDLEKLDAQVKAGLRFHLVDDIRQVLAIAFSEGAGPESVEGVQTLSFDAPSDK